MRLAIAIRRGTPLASYSIDRKCVQQYIAHLTHADSSSLVCFRCARAFPGVHGTKQNPLRRYPASALTKVVNHNIYLHA